MEQGISLTLKNIVETTPTYKAEEDTPGKAVCGDDYSEKLRLESNVVEKTFFAACVFGKSLRLERC